MLTYNAVFHTEAQLKLRIWPPDNCHGDWRTVDDTQLHILLAFQVLKWKKKKHRRVNIQDNKNLQFFLMN